MSIKNVRLEVMQFLEKDIDAYMDKFLVPADKIWQPPEIS